MGNYMDMRTVSYPAAADLTGKEGLAVKYDSNGKIALCSAAGERALGILVAGGLADEAVTVCVAGLCHAVAGAQIATKGAMVKTDAAGKIVTATAATTDTTSGAAADPLVGSFVLGWSEGAPSAADKVFNVYVQPMGAVPTTAA